MPRRRSYAVTAVMLCAASAGWVDAQARSEAAAGSLCVLPHVRRGETETRSPEVPPAAEHYTLRLDGGAWIPLSSQTPVRLARIPVQGWHKVVIRGDDKPFSAFSFSFTQLGRPDLCLSQSGLYLTWRFHPSPSYSGCRCKGITPAPWAASSGGSQP